MANPKKSYGTSGGVEITEDEIARLAEEAEAGYDVETLRRRGGRRPMGSAAAEVVPVRLDPELRHAVEERADEEDTSVSDVIRRALRAFLDVA